MMETPAVNKIILLLSITMFQYLPSFPLIYNNIFFEQNKEEFAVFVYFFVFFKATNEKKRAGTKANPHQKISGLIPHQTQRTETEGFEPSSPLRLTHFECAPL